jgi:rhodanese-related sulfurtransferase
VTDLANLQEDITPEDVRDRLAAGDAIVVDVREGYEREAGHIEGTRHVEFSGLQALADEVGPDTDVVFYCRTGARSAAATQAFRASGFRAFNMAGGLVAWDVKGLPLAPAGGTVADH